MSSPVPLRKEKKLPMPAAPAALGMASSYYTFSILSSFCGGGVYLLALALFILLVIVNFLRVLRVLPGGNAANQKALITALAVSVGFTLGIAARRTVHNTPELGLDPERIISVSGVLKEDPRTLHGGPGLAVLELKGCGGEGGLRASARGNLTVFFPEETIPKLKTFGRGAEIFADGIFTKQTESHGGALFRAASLHITKPAPAPEQFRTGLRMALLERFQSRQESKYEITYKTPVWGSLASALLLGVRDNLDTDLDYGFRNSGCSHVLALSGMHLAIISSLLAFLLKKPLGLRWASLAGAVFIAFYIFVAGSQPSLVRAGIMYLIGTISVWGFLKAKPINLLGMAFIIQLVFQSESGVSISFILSYLALAGILGLGESLRSVLRGRLPDVVNSGLSASLGAFVVTAPVVVFYFGAVRPIGILASLLIAPLSSLFMVLALGALTASFLPLPLWAIFDLVLTGLYRLLEFIVSFFGRLPGLSFSNPFPVLIFSILFYLAALFIQRRDRLYRSSIASFD